MTGTSRHLVVDGSNIATEGRTRPSLAQLDEAVRAVLAEDPDRQVTVIVDATFAHRIKESERQAFEDAVIAGEVITPPAGTVGRGDAFILQVAERADAAVLSNDSFQEFHGEHPWLFDEDRLIGGKPVAEVGWVFLPRVPVRGATSRRAVREAKSEAKGSTKGNGDRKASKRSSKRSSTRSRKSGDRTTAARSGTTEKTENARKAKNARNAKNATKANKADESATDEAVAASSSGPSGNEASAGKKTSKKKGVKELNSPHDFMRFVTQHSIGDEINGVVERFSSHGCYLRASSAQCYLPSKKMGDPPPNRARDVVSIGQEVIARVESIDTDRRGINVELVQAVTDGSSRPDAEQQPKEGKTKPGAGNRRTTEQVTTSHTPTPDADESSREANLTRSDTNVATKKTAKKRPARNAAKKAPAKKAAKATTSARATKAAARRKAAAGSSAKKATKKVAKKVTRKSGAKKATKKAGAKKTTKRATTKAGAKKATKRGGAKKATKKTTARKTSAKKSTKRTARQPAKKAAATTSAKKTAKRGARKASAKKASTQATKRATRKASAKKSTKKATKKASAR